MKNTIFILLLCFGFTYAQAQEVYTSSGKAGYHKKTQKNKGYDPSKLVLGGGFQAAFGGGYAVAGIAPIVGYHFTKNFVAGVGIGYVYSQQPDPGFSPPYTYNTSYDKENIVYPNLWMHYTVYRGLYVAGSLEYDFINLKQPDYDYSTGTQVQVTDNLNVTAVAFLVGLGYRMPLGGRASVFIEGMYDVLQETYSPYLEQPVFRAGIAVGL